MIHDFKVPGMTHPCADQFGAHFYVPGGGPKGYGHHGHTDRRISSEVQTVQRFSMVFRCFSHVSKV